MKYSMTQWIFGGEPLETTLQRLQKLGYDGIELNPDPTCFDDTAAVRKLFDKYNIEPSMMDLTPFHDLSHPDKAKRDEAIAINKVMLKATRQIGCKKMLVCGTEVGRIRCVSSYEEEWKLGLETIRELADFAASQGVLFVMELINHYETCLFYNVERGLRFAEDLNHENVAVMIDTYHMNIEEPDPCDAIRLCASKLANFHISDSNRQGVGQGHIDFVPILRTLKQVGYSDYIGFEPQAPGPDPFNAVKAPNSKELVEGYLRDSINIIKGIEAAV